MSWVCDDIDVNHITLMYDALSHLLWCSGIGPTTLHRMVLANMLFGCIWIRGHFQPPKCHGKGYDSMTMFRVSKLLVEAMTHIQAQRS